MSEWHPTSYRRQCQSLYLAASALAIVVEQRVSCVDLNFLDNVSVYYSEDSVRLSTSINEWLLQADTTAWAQAVLEILSSDSHAIERLRNLEPLENFFIPCKYLMLCKIHKLQNK